MGNLNLGQNRGTADPATPSWPEENPFDNDRPGRQPSLNMPSGQNPGLGGTERRNRESNQLPANLGDNNTLLREKISNVIHRWHLKFTGSHDDITVDEFIYRINTLTSVHLKGNFEVLCEHAHSLFEGKAKKWFWRYIRQTDNLVWFDLCDALRVQYKDTTTDYDIKDDMRRRRQKPTETFDEYLDSMMSSSDKLRVPISEQELVEIVIRNLKAELRHELLHLEITNIHALRREVRKHEKFFYDIRTNSSRGTNFNRRQISELVQDDPVDFVDEPSTLGIEEVNALDSTLQKCWNCDVVGHRYQDCLAPRRIFCYGCGAIDTYRPSCPKCSSRSGNLVSDVRRRIGGHPRNRLEN